MVRIGKNCSMGVKYASGHTLDQAWHSFSQLLFETVDLKDLKNFYSTPPMPQNSTLLRNCRLCSNMHIAFTSNNNYSHFIL